MAGSAMTDCPPGPHAAAGERLMTALARLLGDSMGCGRGLPAPRPIGRPAQRALLLFAAFLLLWAAAWAATELEQRVAELWLYAIVVWVGVYGVARIFLAQITTAQVFATVARDIVPYASPAYLEAVAVDLERRTTFGWRTLWPLLLATLGTAATFWMLGMEIHRPVDFRTPEWLFGGAMVWLSFFISARSVGAGRFHLSFAKCLEKEEQGALYLLGASESPLVEGLAKLGGQILVFWVAVFLVIMSILLLWLPEFGVYRVPPTSTFLLILASFMIFLTLGMGSITYLRSEARIRETLRRFTLAQAAVLQQRINALLDPRSGRLPDDPGELQRLADWHDRILAGGRYGSPAGTAVSIALPFLLPAASLIKSLYDSLP
jgi:amino acid transporter